MRDLDLPAEVPERRPAVPLADLELGGETPRAEHHAARLHEQCDGDSDDRLAGFEALRVDVTGLWRRRRRQWPSADRAASIGVHHGTEAGPPDIGPAAMHSRRAHTIQSLERLRVIGSALPS